jgi:hypothetical protein
MGRLAPLLAILAALVTLVLPAVAGATPAKQYVLKHPRHEHCKAHYVKKVETVRVRKAERRVEFGRTVKVRETFCVYVAPKTAPAPPTLPAPVATPAPPVEPFATTTTLSVSTVKCPHEGEEELNWCEYKITYATVNRFGESPPGAGPVLQEHVPPSQELRTIAVPSGATVHVNWYVTRQGECRISLGLVGSVAPAEYSCERATPRVILTASYLNPAEGWLTSQSEPQTLR